MKDHKPIGQTKDAGFQIGVRKTFAVDRDKLWAFVLSKKGVELWFGNVATELPYHQPFRSEEGMEGLITTLQEGSHLRMKWKKPNWEHFSMLQIRVIPAGNKATLSFHQDQLISESQRAEMKTHWAVVIDKVGDRIASL
ncbi:MULTISPECIES: SRPBCC domain-containing protein [unclassified Imperialibacter]|uniref:SRPBCC domain-containing protein n=1 Tax=unclassified Imperialibacter TaxID=2629706 RepID=UPI001256933C|nr:MULTISPECIES: SRPBCC domain-containing protein [unclassified Imperialibacter]CAD5267656.1 ATPase [Imperialibacter sp. 75]CAD5280070.1 ATPase [Imperialibacter sp. 89]VVT01228.1 ATPase [Imperialibacter sp. EC-SDR9]